MEQFSHTPTITSTQRAQDRIPSPMLTAALAYRRRGWALIPLKPAGKEPCNELLPRDKEGRPRWGLLTDRPATEAEIRRWFEQNPDINIGILTGRPSGGLVVVDVDVATPPPTLHLPPTVAATTGRGGHYYYQAQEPVRSSAHPWGDIKGEGGYVVAPPSRHPSGAIYAFADFCGPEEHGLASFPAHLTGSKKPPAAGSATATTDRKPRPEEQAHGGSPAADSQVSKWLRSLDVAKAILRACGLRNVELDKPFCCILPGHKERRPSASLRQFPNGVIGYRDYHRRDVAEWYALAEVYASVKLGKVVKLGPAERIPWFLRALVEIGYVKLPPVTVEGLPSGATAVVRDVFEGFQLLVAVRTFYDPHQVDAPYSWRFASLWTGRSERHCGVAIKWLLANGYLTAGDSAPGKGPGRGATLLRLGSAA